MRTLTSRAVCVAILFATSGLVSPAGQSRLPEPCSVPDLFLAIARGAAIPAGVEFLAEPCQRDRRMPDPTEYSALLGLALPDAFDRVAAMDSRYRWVEDNGVAVLRPEQAWSNRSHFLHGPVPAFAFERLNLVGALMEIKLAMGQDVSAMREMVEQSAKDGQRTFSVKTNATSVVGLLDAVVRAHGGMQWRISYCRPEAAREFVELTLTTADGRGVMSPATYPRAANATPRDCHNHDPVPAREPVTARVIDTNMLLRLPLAPCAVPSTAGTIGKATGIPVGAEYLDEPCLWDRHQSDPNQTPITLLSLTVAEALDTLVKLDPRYRWIESNGVILVRPITASADPKHFLHQTVSSFAFENKSLSGALHAVYLAMGHDGSDQRAAQNTPDGAREFSVNVSSTSIVEALTEIVRVHGAMRWEIGYCYPKPSLEHAIISLYTYDGAGLGRRAPGKRGADGKIDNSCPMR